MRVDENTSYTVFEILIFLKFFFFYFIIHFKNLLERLEIKIIFKNESVASGFPTCDSIGSVVEILSNSALLLDHEKKMY